MKAKFHGLAYVVAQALTLLVNVDATALEYPVVPVTKKVSVIYGPLALPNEKNRGFRNTVVVVKTIEGLVIFDPGGSAYAGEKIAKSLKNSSDLPVWSAPRKVVRLEVRVPPTL